MLTLHKLFFKKFLKDWFLMAISCFVVLFLFGAFGKSLPEFVKTVMIFYIMGVPLMYAIATNNDFQENLDWLINYQYNRKQLITFFITSQSIKLILTTLIYSCYYFLITLSKRNIDKASKIETTIIEDLSEFFFSSSGFSVLYLILIVGVFIIFFGSLYKSNAEFIRRQMIINKTANSGKFKNVYSFKNKSPYQKFEWCYFIMLISLTLYHAFDTFVVEVFITSAIGLYSIRLFNRKFKALSLSKENTFGMSLSIILILPYFLFVFSGISEISNKKLSNRIRVSAIQFTELFHTPSKRNLIELVSKNKNCNDLYVLSYFLGQQSISSSHLLANIPKKCDIYRALSVYSRFGIENDLIVQIKKYIEINNLNEDIQILFAAKLFVKGSEVGFSKRRFTDYINEKDTFTSYLGLRMARRSLSYKNYRILIKDKFESMNSSVKKLGSVKRAIASVEDKKVKKSKNEHVINYDNY